MSKTETCSAHTPGLLSMVGQVEGWNCDHDGIGSSCYSGIRIADTGEVIALAVAHTTDLSANPDCRPNARRLVACWNACHDEDIAYLEGVISLGTTLRKVHIETLTIKETYQHELCAMERQRDALLASLQAILKAATPTVAGKKLSPLEAISTGRPLMVALMDAEKVVAKRDWSAA